MQFLRPVPRVQARRWECSLEKTSSAPTVASTVSELRANVGEGKLAISIAKLATVNVLDLSRAEITPADPKFAKAILSAIQQSVPNASTQVGPQKILLTLPKSTAADRDARAEAVKRLSESYKNEVRDLRRRALSELKNTTKDRDAIAAFERDLQKEHDSAVKSIDELMSAKLRLIGVKK